MIERIKMIKITDELKNRIRDHEGCVDTVYLDSLGKATVGIGHLVKPHEHERFHEGVKLSQEEIEDLFDIDLNRAAAGADRLISNNCPSPLPEIIHGVILEMVFQLGEYGVGKFKNMWTSLAEGDFKAAAEHMKDSRWHAQTKNRCESLASMVANAA